MVLGQDSQQYNTYRSFFHMGYAVCIHARTYIIVYGMFSFQYSIELLIKRKGNIQLWVFFQFVKLIILRRRIRNLSRNKMV